MKKLSGPFVLAAILAAHIGFVVATEESYTFRDDDAPSIKTEAPGVDVSFSTLKGGSTVTPNAMVSLTDNNTRIN